MLYQRPEPSTCTSQAVRFLATCLTTLVCLIWAVPECANANPAHGVEKAIESTVFIRVDHIFSGRLTTSTGTGFLVHQDGWIVTNAHVVSDTALVMVGKERRRARAKVKKVTVILNSGAKNEVEVEARIVARDAEVDLALLKIQGPQQPILDIWNPNDTSVTQ